MRIIGMIAAMAVILTGAAVAGAAVKSTQYHQGASMPAGMDMPMAGHAAAPDLPAAQLATARLATAKYSNDLARRRPRLRHPHAADRRGWATTSSIRRSRASTSASRRSSCTRSTGDAGSSARSSGSSRRRRRRPRSRVRRTGLPGGLPLQGRHVRPEASQDTCATTSPESGSPFNFWHPALVTMHVWIWYPNPDGMYASMNPLVARVQLTRRTSGPRPARPPPETGTAAASIGRVSSTGRPLRNRRSRLERRTLDFARGTSHAARDGTGVPAPSTRSGPARALRVRRGPGRRLRPWRTAAVGSCWSRARPESARALWCGISATRTMRAHGCSGARAMRSRRHGPGSADRHRGDGARRCAGRGLRQREAARGLRRAGR